MTSKLLRISVSTINTYCCLMMIPKQFIDTENQVVFEANLSQLEFFPFLVTLACDSLQNTHTRKALYCSLIRSGFALATLLRWTECHSRYEMWFHSPVVATIPPPWKAKSFSMGQMIFLCYGIPQESLRYLVVWQKMNATLEYKSHVHFLSLAPFQRLFYTTSLYIMRDWYCFV